MLRTADEAAAMMPWVAEKFDGRIWRLDLYLFKIMYGKYKIKMQNNLELPSLSSS